MKTFRTLGKNYLLWAFSLCSLAMVFFLLTDKAVRKESPLPRTIEQTKLGGSELIARGRAAKR